MTLLSTLFVSLLTSLIPKIEVPMSLVGVAYMLYLAWTTFKSGSEIAEKNAKNSFLSGLMLQFINPKAYIYSIVSMDAYIIPHYANESLILVGFALLLAFIGFVFTVCWSAFGSVFKLLFSKHGKVTNTIMALLLVYCAFSLLF